MILDYWSIKLDTLPYLDPFGKASAYATSVLCNTRALAMNILSIQSFVSRGHVGNSTAVFCFQLFGFDVCPIPTTLLSNHPGHPGFRGGHLSTKNVQELLHGLSELNTFKQCDAVISGYFANPDIALLISDVVSQIKSNNPAAIYLCDPVMGNHEKGLYVPTDVPKAISTHLLPIADILTPNHFELERLCGQLLGTKEASISALQEITLKGHTVGVCSSSPGSSKKTISTFCHYIGDTWEVETPKLATLVNGRGDCLSAVFLANYLSGKNCKDSLSSSVSTVYSLLQLAEADARDLPLVAGQGLILCPTTVFTAELLDANGYK